VAANDLRLQLELWFPTVVRYLGVVLAAYIGFIDHAQNPALIPVATGLILFKTVYGNGNGKKKE
jgi:hypothetical protein